MLSDALLSVTLLSVISLINALLSIVMQNVTAECCYAE
jgi:hypothetical protein